MLVTNADGELVTQRLVSLSESGSIVCHTVSVLFVPELSHSLSLLFGHITDITRPWLADNAPAACKRAICCIRECFACYQCGRIACHTASDSNQQLLSETMAAEYRSLVGLAMYVSLQRFDIQYSVKTLASSCSMAFSTLFTSLSFWLQHVLPLPSD